MRSRLIVMSFAIFCMATTELQKEPLEIFAEGLSSNSTTKPSRIVGRKGATLDTADQNTSQSSSHEIRESSSILTNSSVTSDSPKTLSSTSTKEVPPTKKSHIELSSTIGFDNTTCEADECLNPKASADKDRLINKSPDSRWHFIVICVSLTTALLAVIAIGSFSYRKVKSWMEIRHYQRVVSLSLPFLLSCLIMSFVGLSCRRNVRLVSSSIDQTFVILCSETYL